MGMFDKPKTIVQAPKKALAKEKAKVALPGIEHLAMIDALQKTLETLRTTLEGEVKGQAAERFAQHIAQTGQRPESFIASDGEAEANVQFRRKSSAYALSEEAVAVLRANELEPVKEVITPELFAINPAHAGNKDLLAKVEKAIAKIVPDDFIIMQTEQSKLIATEETLNAAISKRAPAAVFQVLTTIACAPKLKNTNISAILDFVRDLIAPAAPAAAEDGKKKLRVVK